MRLVEWLMGKKRPTSEAKDKDIQARVERAEAAKIMALRLEAEVYRRSK